MTASAANLAGQFGDTTYTKVFVGGLAWETHKETMKKYFEQFGDILEAVVITDKSTGRSKGYGFVTFREADAAMRACVDAAPVIDGRRANCNLASLGVQRSKPSTTKHGGGGGRNFKMMSSFQTGFQGGVGAAFPSAATFPHYAIQQGIPAYNVYGYPPYHSSDYTYPTSYYNVYGGATSQYPLYGAAAGLGGMMSGGATAGFYPYLHQFGEGNDGAAATGGYTTPAGGLQFPHHQLFQYSAAGAGAGGAINSTGTYPQYYGAPISLAPSPALQSGKRERKINQKIIILELKIPIENPGDGFWWWEKTFKFNISGPFGNFMSQSVEMECPCSHLDLLNFTRKLPLIL